MNKNNSEIVKKLDFIDHCVSKGIWFLNRKEIKKGYRLLKIALFDVMEICKENNIKLLEISYLQYPIIEQLLDVIF